MSSTKKIRNKEDTWRQEDLEKSIKNALADSNEKPRSKHRNKEDRVRDTTDTDIIRKEKHSKERHSQRSSDKNSENVDHDKSRSSRSKDKEGNEHEKREDRHKRREDRHEKREEKRERRDDRNERSEDKRERREDGRERKEDRRERREDRRERRDDKHERMDDRSERRDDRHERSEDKRERRDERRKRREDGHDRSEDGRERKEDRRERRDDKHERREDKRERRDDKHERREDRRDRREDKERRRSRNDDSNKIHAEDEKGSGEMIDDEDQRHKSRRHKSHKESKHRDRDRDENRDRDRHKDRENDENRRKSSTKHSESKYEDPSYQDDGSNYQQPRKISRDEMQEESHTTIPEDNDAYEDDFEDYEDDFEDTGQGDSEENADDMESSEIAALRRAMEKENDATLRKSRERDSTSSKSAASSRSDKKQTRQTFINFTAAKQRQINTKVAQRTKQRGRRLMNLIELDVSSCSLFEMPPVKVYELYIKSYGRSNTKQAFTQCNDDSFDRDVQTEPIETRDVLIQHPSDGTPIVYGNSCTKGNTAVKLNSLRLSVFLEKAGQVMNTILEDNISDNYKRRGLQSNQRNILFSQGYTKISSDLSFLKGRHVTRAQFHPVQTNLLLTVYSRPKVQDGKDLTCQDILCVWNVHSPSHPYRILKCKSEVTCCCFSPVKSTFAFAGTADGSILVWDLREPSSMHTRISDDEGVKWSLQVPTFSTCGVHYEENHHNVVTKLLPVITSQDAPSLPNAEQGKKTDETHGLSFQLASLDQQGLIHFWVVIDMDQTDNAGSETDLGLVPNGKVKLLKSSSITLDNPSRNMLQGIQAKDMKFSLKHPNEFYVATDLGYILHGSRHGDRVSPRCYKRHGDVPVAVIQLDFSPFGLPCFLAASSDGCIYLYSLALDSPLLTWSNSTSDMPIVSLSWSRSRPSVFYVVDVTSKVYVWELLVNQGSPVKTEQFTNGRVITMELSNDHSATGRGMPGRTASMIIADDKGSVEVHTLNQQFSVPSDNELQLMMDFLNAFK